MKAAVAPMQQIRDQLLEDIKRDSESFDTDSSKRKQRKKKQPGQRLCRMA